MAYSFKTTMVLTQDIFIDSLTSLSKGENFIGRFISIYTNVKNCHIIDSITEEYEVSEKTLKRVKEVYGKQSVDLDAVESQIKIVRHAFNILSEKISKNIDVRNAIIDTIIILNSFTTKTAVNFYLIS